MVDLSKVDYIDSSGVASLVEGYQLSRTQELDFGLVGVSDAAMNCSSDIASRSGGQAGRWSGEKTDPVSHAN